MGRKMLYPMFLCVFVFLVACGEGNDQDHNSGSELNFDPLEVEVIAPEEAEPNEEIVLQAFVTQGEDKVNDASEVMFEIWQQEQKENSEFVEAELTEFDGIYEIRYTFKENNIYHIQPHVTARGMHMMPRAEIKVGDVPEGDLEQE